MLKYGLTERFIRHLSHLPFENRLNVLWKIQGLLSHVPGYLKLRVSGSEEDPIYKIDDDHYVLAHDDYESRILVDFASDIDSLKNNGEYITSTIVSLLGKKELDEDVKERFKDALDQHFPVWFINLLLSLPLESQNVLMSKEEIKETEEEEKAEEEKEAEIIKAPAIDILEQASKLKNIKPKSDLEGERFEKEILRELAKSYNLRKENAAPKASKPLSHVRFAPREVVVSFSSLGECLFLLKKRTTKLGCKNFNSDWKILLASTVDDHIAKELGYRYPNHVCYTDDPNKGELKLALIVKPKKKEEKEDLGIKKVASKTASFAKALPSGAFENIDEDDVPEYFGNSDFKPFIQKNVVHVSNETKIEKIEEQMEEFALSDDFFDMDEFPINEPETDSYLPSANDEPEIPAHWHCHLCGKKKLYSGEPAEIVELSSGKVVYLCAKHRGKM